jgi:hypothetical protein
MVESDPLSCVDGAIFRRFPSGGQGSQDAASALQLSAYDREKYADKSESMIRMDLIMEINMTTPKLLSHFVFDHNHTVSSEAAKRKRLSRKVKQMERWHKIASVVGWAGVALSDWFSSAVITEATDETFDRFLGFFSVQRPRVLAMMEEYWPDAPQLLKIVSSESHP